MRRGGAWGEAVLLSDYKCRFCEREFNDGHPYCNLEDAKNNLAGLMAFRPIHYCDGGHIGIGYFTGLERVDKDE